MANEILPRRYTDIELVGQGGFGRVYRARDTHLDRWVAAKVAIHRQDEIADVEGFVAEARRAARLQHPNIVAIHDLDFHDEHLFLTMEFASGGTLDERAWGGADPAIVARVVAQAAEGLGHAHDQGLVHRDVKPSNLLLDQHDIVKVGDFGLVREIDRSTTHLAGTTAYMAPEQFTEGKYPTPAADVFALAVTTYELLTGTRHGGFSTLAAGEPPPPVSTVRNEITPEVDEVLNKALEFNRLNRTDDVRGFAEQLGRALGARPNPAEVRAQAETALAHVISGHARDKPHALRFVAARTVAGVKWSGAAKARDAARAIKVAIIEDGVARLAESLDREAATEAIDQLGDDSERALVGIDFGFGLPYWYMQESGFEWAPDLWSELARIEEESGRESQWPREQLGYPYWGPQIRPKPDFADHAAWFRETEQAVRERTGTLGFSVFQLSGAGSVGSQTARGVGRLLDLRQRGWAVWPFDSQGDHTIVEVFPKAYRSLIVGSQLSLDAGAEREAILGAINRDLNMDAELLRALEEDHAALDSMLAAWLLWRSDPDLPDLTADPVAIAEGRIWLPE